VYRKSVSAIFTAVRLLFKNRRTLVLTPIVYAGLLAATCLFVSTREATIAQLILTLIVVIVAPALFFFLQVLSVGYPSAPGSVGPIKRLLSDCLKLIVVSAPVIALTVLAVYGLNKIQSHLTIVTALRYLLVAVVAPLFAIQLWIATSTSGLRSLVRSFGSVLAGTFAPQSMFVYACGFVVFAVGPYLLVWHSIPTERAWLELSLLILRLSLSAMFVLLGWVTTVGAISILSRNSYLPASQKRNG
jgi:hypothetical protein